MYRTVEVSIASGQSLSSSTRIDYPVGPAQNGVREALVAIIMPPAWTTADLTFQASNDGTNFFNMYNVAGSELTAEAGALRWIEIQPVDFSGVPFVKVRSGTAGSPVNQGATRSITLLFRPVS